MQLTTCIPGYELSLLSNLCQLCPASYLCFGGSRGRECVRLIVACRLLAQIVLIHAHQLFSLLWCCLCPCSQRNTNDTSVGHCWQLAADDGASAFVIKNQFDQQNLEKQLCAMASHEHFDIKIYSRNQLSLFRANTLFSCCDWNLCQWWILLLAVWVLEALSRIENKNFEHGMNTLNVYLHFAMPAVAERLRLAYPAPPGRAGVGSIPANPDAQNVPSFRRWRFEMKLSPFLSAFCYATGLHRQINSLWSAKTGVACGGGFVI